MWLDDIFSDMMYLVILSCGIVVGGRAAHVDSLGDEQCTGKARGSQISPKIYFPGRKEPEHALSHTRS